MFNSEAKCHCGQTAPSPHPRSPKPKKKYENFTMWEFKKMKAFIHKFSVCSN
ncbi:Hypothetical protein Cp1002B_1576 [Corynebacterium pseudotuberculosis]|nr:Hypothetical protein CpPAT10_1081 [Corynebacterium pseudotuberculosis PAT10]AEP70330.1 Hypothetical protein Cp4202_1074 [Corynebacterium pseudotuberculosis 42/02-A]AFF22239.1 Hypothetical protein CpP54B96_1102 [Corynebacterium pseudotuberculosis P54B96]AFH52033.1 Hypothetical protein Cp267_1134 [Corynebacterium pseudotuberculosis 267]AJC13827.1 Hypothetical protein CpVD57_1110 [Corynebacterium pseudotuberculosis]